MSVSQLVQQLRKQDTPVSEGATRDDSTTFGESTTFGDSTTHGESATRGESLWKLVDRVVFIDSTWQQTHKMIRVSYSLVPKALGNGARGATALTVCGACIVCMWKWWYCTWTLSSFPGRPTIQSLIACISFPGCPTIPVPMCQCGWWEGLETRLIPTMIES